MNVPGQAEGNWSWRCTPEMLDAKHFQRLKRANGGHGTIVVTTSSQLQGASPRFVVSCRSTRTLAHGG